MSVYFTKARLGVAGYANAPLLGKIFEVDREYPLYTEKIFQIDREYPLYTEKIFQIDCENPRFLAHTWHPLSSWSVVR
jgi:hypothetical protein